MSIRHSATAQEAGRLLENAQRIRLTVVDGAVNTDVFEAFVEQVLE